MNMLRENGQKKINKKFTIELAQMKTKPVINIPWQRYLEKCKLKT